MKKWNVSTVRAAKGKVQLGCVTAYDACYARLADQAGVPIILVGDSIGNNVLGFETTLPVNMEDTLSAVKAVVRGVKDAMVVGDMPFGSYQCGDDLAMQNAVSLIKAGADCVKLEGGIRVAKLIKRMTEAGIPVLAHVGMTPQSVNEYGGFKKQGKTLDAAKQILEDAIEVVKAGAFAVTLECVPDDLAAKITASISVPTIGVGAGPYCDAQWLVMHDLLGLNESSPKFAKRYLNLAEIVRSSFSKYVEEVSNDVFPPRK
jgi:3-methyl-2-oxobutanoate hydroxymethyltransferase